MSWLKTTLGDLVDIFSVRAKDYGGSANLDFYGVSNNLGIIKAKYAATEKAEGYKIIEKGCFVYNPYRINVGSIGYYNEESKGLISPAYVVFKPKSGRILPELLLRYLKSADGLRQIKLHSGGTVRQALRFDDLCKITLTLPEIEEQQILYNKFTLAQHKYETVLIELSTQRDLIKSLRKSLLMDAMQGKLTEQNQFEDSSKDLIDEIKQERKKALKNGLVRKDKVTAEIRDDEIPFVIPPNWSWCRLGEIVIFQNGYPFKSEWFRNEGIPLLRNINMGVNEVIWDDVVRLPKSIAVDYEDYFLQKNDIVLSLDRPIINSGLKTAQIRSHDLPCILLQRVLKIKPILVDNDYVFKWINSDLFISYINPGSSIGIPHISHKAVSTIPIPVPPLLEQKRIVEKLNQIANKLDEFEKNVFFSRRQVDDLIDVLFREMLGLSKIEEEAETQQYKLKINRFILDENEIFKTTSMSIIEILRTTKDFISATAVWNSSEYSTDIEKFYAELKRLIDVEKTVIEEKRGKESFLKLALNEN